MLSVIIPVYNVLPTLRRCVDSVLGQLAVGMQVILVDDGSTDGSGALADTYGRLPGVMVVHQANGGLSAARNAGLEQARGAYVTFVDSDDYVEPGTYEALLRELALHPDCDILEYPVRREMPGGTETLALHEAQFDDMRRYWVTAEAYAHAYAWNKIYRRKLFDGVRYPVGKRFEDVYTLADLLRHARQVRTTPQGLYHYTANPEGITRRADGGAWRDLLDGHLRLVDSDEQLQRTPGFADYYRQLLNIQLYTYRLTGDNRDIRLPELTFHHTWKLRLLHVLGMRRLCHLYRLVAR